MLPPTYGCMETMMRTNFDLRKQHILGACVVGAVSLLSSSALATTYYIDNSTSTASDQNAGTSKTAPWASLAPVMKKSFAPGDVIALKAGTVYSGGLQMTAKGTASAPITITSFGTGPKPTIKGDPTYGSWADAIELDNSQYVVVDGLALGAAAHAGVNLYQTNNSVVRNSEMFGVGIGVNILGQSNQVTGNSFHDLKMVVNNGTASNYGAEGVVVGGPSNEISYNNCLRCIADDNYFGLNGKLIELYGTVDNSYIHHNYAQDSGNFLEGGVGTARNVRITYNVSVNNNGGFLNIHYTGAFAYTGPTSFLVANNTAIQTAAIANPNSALNYIDAPPTAGSILVVNNIMFINQMAALYSYDVPRQNNIYYMKQTTSHVLITGSNALGSGEMIADPVFVDPTLPNLRIAATSPARGAGVTIATTTIGSFDFARNPLPASSPDIGAYQYQP